MTKLTNKESDSKHKGNESVFVKDWMDFPLNK